MARSLADGVHGDRRAAHPQRGLQRKVIQAGRDERTLLRLSRISIARCADLIRSSAYAWGPLSWSVHPVAAARATDQGPCAGDLRPGRCGQCGRTARCRARRGHHRQHHGGPGPAGTADCLVIRPALVPGAGRVPDLAKTAGPCRQRSGMSCCAGCRRPADGRREASVAACARIAGVRIDARQQGRNYRPWKRGSRLSMKA
jgi:hypothetical protein